MNEQELRSRFINKRGMGRPRGNGPKPARLPSKAKRDPYAARISDQMMHNGGHGRKTAIRKIVHVAH